MAQRRKSALSQQAALAGVSFAGGDNPPGMGTRGRLGGPADLSHLMTPASGMSRIPVAGSSTGRRPIADRKAPQASTSRATARNVSTRSRPPGLKRTSSVPEGLHSAMGKYTTPRNRSQSPGPASATRPGPGAANKITKIPTVSDKDWMCKIAAYIVEGLEKLNYPEKFKELSFRNMKLNTKQLQTVFMFLTDQLYGPNEGADKKEDAAYIFEALQYLQCPVTISKSHLKTLNTQHSLPTVYTAIAWLIMQLDRFYFGSVTPLSQRLDEDDVAESKWKKLVVIFENQGNEEVKESVLEEFKQETEAYYDINHGPSTTELANELNENQELLASLQATEDPRTSLQHTLKFQDEMIQKTNNQIATSESQLEKLTDLNSLRSEITVITSEINRHKLQLRALRDVVGKQSMTREQAEACIVETEKLRKQCESLKVVNEKLKRQLQNEQQFQANNMKRFYEVCEKFSDLESYNNLAIRWKDVLPQISKNPFDVDSMSTWLENVHIQVPQMRSFVASEIKRLNANLRSCKRTEATLDVKLESMEEERVRLESENSFRRHEDEKRVESICSDLEALVVKIDQSVTSNHALESQLVTMSLELEKNQKELQNVEEWYEDRIKLEKDLSYRVEEEHASTKLVEKKLKANILAQVIEARKQFYGPIPEVAELEKTLSEMELNSASQAVATNNECSQVCKEPPLPTPSKKSRRKKK